MAYPCAAAACQPPCGRVYLRYKRQELAATASEESSMVMAASHGATRPNAANGVISRCQATEPYKFCRATRSEEHTSELQSLMRISYAVFCLKKKKNKNTNIYYTNQLN